MSHNRIETVLVVGLILFAVGAIAQTVTLNRPLGAHETAGFLGMTPEGRSAVYHVLYEDEYAPPAQAKEWIYTVPDAGGASHEVFQATGEFLGDHAIASSGYIVARLFTRSAWDGSATIQRLVSVNLTDGTTTDLNNGVPGEGYNGETLQLTADGRTLVFRQSTELDGQVYNLYSVPAAGGPWVKLNGDTGLGVVEKVLITPDQTRVVYAEQTLDYKWPAIYVIPIGGGTSQKLTPADVTDVRQYEVTSDSQTLVYRAVAQVYKRAELYSAPLSGGTPTKLNRPVAPSAGVSGIFGFTLSPQGDHVAYVGTQDTADVLEVYTVPVAGGEIVKLNPPLVANGDVNQDVLAFSPDGGHVVYYADQQVDGREDIYSVPSLGGSAIRLNSVTEQANPSSWMQPVFTSDSRYVFWKNTGTMIDRSRLDTTETLQLFYGAIKLSADERHLISWSTPTEIRRTPLSGTPVFLLSDPLPDGRIVDYWLSPDMTRFVYEASSSSASGIFSKPCGLTPELGAAAEQPPAQIALAWSDDSPCSPTQYLGFAYDVYGSQFVQRGWNGTMWFPFGWWTRAGQLDVGQTGAYFA
ncbi:MAG: hypothetical protein NTW86_29810, partial [Candidatus Sumerlaeota bacterium]|nr:hypothetical protein [Candidatus Sumerlaeota bacterium]